MKNRNSIDDLNWKNSWKRMQGEKTQPLKITFDSRFKNKFAEDYSERAKFDNYIYGRKAVEALNKILQKEFKVLEVGAGPGTLTIPLSRKVKKVIAIESSKIMMSYLAKNIKKNQTKNIEVINKNWENIDPNKFKNKFDLVICSHFLWQMRNIEKHLKRMENASNKYCAIIQPVGRDNVVKKVWAKISGEDYQGQFEPDADYFVYLILRKWSRLVQVKIVSYRVERNFLQEVRYIASFVGRYIEVDNHIEKIIENYIAGMSENKIYKTTSSAVIMWWKKIL